ncbi:MAG: hypothetical protein ACLQDM_15825 [Bradyrhizobium sp.]
MSVSLRVEALDRSMEHPVRDFHVELDVRDELTYRNAKSPASTEAGLALTDR